MKLGIMQPYLFPYIGYFQLLAAVDKFIVYDDVTFIKQGWVNRNRILLEGKDEMFTVPIQDQSSFKLIHETQILKNPVWRRKLLVKFEHAYKKAPFFKPVFELVRGVLDSTENLIGAMAVKGIKSVCGYLDIHTRIIEHSAAYGNAHLKAQDRVLDLCAKEKASVYINAAGGTELYSKDDFRNRGIELQFLRSKEIAYRQLGAAFVPGLSIIDVMMFNSPEETRELLKRFELL